MQEQGEDTGAVDLDTVFSDNPDLGDAGMGEGEGGGEETQGQPRDPVTQRFTSKDAPDEGAEGDEAAGGEGDQQQARPVHHVPLTEHLSEREKRQAAERRAEELERRWDEFQARQRQQEEAPHRPDLYGDPNDVFSYIENSVEQRLAAIRQEQEDARIEDTFAEMAEAHGEKFDEAFKAIQQAPQDVHLMIRRAPNPGKALMRWHGEQRAMQMIGGDLDGFLTKKQEEWLSDPKVREKIMQQMRDEAAGNSMNGRSTVTIPSVGRASGGRGGSNRVMDSGSPTDVFESIFPD